jgi:hypothetical protein
MTTGLRLTLLGTGIASGRIGRYVDQIHLLIVLIGVFGMNDVRRAALDFEIIVNAFDLMGRYLRDQCSIVGEIAVYGGTAMLLQFPWRTMTEDVDVTILTGEPLHSGAMARLPELVEEIQLRRTG